MTSPLIASCLAALRDARLEPDIMSVFIYGSASREAETVATSDLEIGVVPRPDHQVSRRQLAAVVPERVRPYVFELAALRAGRPRVPFTPHVFMRDLSATARTVLGEPVVESLPGPAVTALDLLSEARFTTGRVFQALLEARAGHDEIARDALAKGVLYGARVLVAGRRAHLPIGFGEIARSAHDEVPAEHRWLLESALGARAGRTDVGVQAFYGALELLTDVVVPAATAWCQESPNCVLVGPSVPRAGSV